jgi:hypothetical protein
MQQQRKRTTTLLATSLPTTAETSTSTLTMTTTTMTTTVLSTTTRPNNTTIHEHFERCCHEEGCLDCVDFEYCTTCASGWLNATEYVGYSWNGSCILDDGAGRTKIPTTLATTTIRASSAERPQQSLLSLSAMLMYFVKSVIPR